MTTAIALRGWRRPNRGFALIVVLWTLVLIAFIVVQMTASGRVETQIASNLVANAEAAAAADGAISDAIFNLADPLPERRWPIDGTIRTIAIGASRVELRLTDESARVNPNLASPALLQALLQATGNDAANAQQLAAAIADWIGIAAPPRTPDEILADYRAAGRDYAGPRAPLETIDELGRVLGVTPTVLTALRPHLSLFAPSLPDPAHADPIVAAALVALATAGTPGAPAPAAAASQATVRITAVAEGPGGARVTRGAIVRTGSSLPQGYAVLAWGSRLD